MRKKPRSYKTGVLPQTAFYMEELRGKSCSRCVFLVGEAKERLPEMVRRTTSNVTTAVLVYYSIGRTISTKPNLTSYLHTFYYDITYCPNDDTNAT